MPETFEQQVNRVIGTIDTVEPPPDTFEAQVAGALKNAPVKQQSQVNLGLAEGTNPDTEGKILKLADQSGYDPAMVRVDPAKVESQINSYKGGDDQLDEYYAKDPSNAAISGDDWVKLIALQSLMPSVSLLAKVATPAIEDFKKTETFRRLSTEELTAGSVAQTVGAAVGLGVTSLSRAFSQTMDLVAPLIVDKRKLDFADKNLEKLTVTADLENWLRTKVGDTKFEELLASAVESTATMLAATATGGTGAALPAISFVSGVAKTTEAREAGAPMTEALLAGATSAAIEYWTEKIPLETLFDPAKGFIEKLLKGGIADMAGELTATASEMWAIDQEILGGEHKTLDEYKQALYETAIVSLMMTSGATTATHPFVKDDTVTPPPEGDTGGKKTLQELMATADFTPPVQDAVTAPIVSDIVRQDVAVESDKVFHQNLTDIRQAIGETKTNERSPAHMKEVLKSFDMTEDVFISSDGIKNLYQENKASEATAVLESIGVDPIKARETIATGEDTVVQKATVVTVEEEVYNAIDSYIKQSPASHTKQELADNEATEEKQNSGTELKETIDRQKKVDAEIARLESEIASTELPDAQLAGDAPVVLRGLAEKLEGFGLDPVEQLKNITIKRTPFGEFELRMGTQFQETLVEQKDKGFFKQAFGAVKDLVTGKVKVDAKQPVVEGATTEERLQNMEANFNETFFQGAFHGTPFRFDKFSLEHLGKGEGAQAFGWGLYFAEKKDIAEFYRKTLTGKGKLVQRTYKGQGIFNAFSQDTQIETIRAFQTFYAKMAVTPPATAFKEAQQRTLEELRDIQESTEVNLRAVNRPEAFQSTKAEDIKRFTEIIDGVKEAIQIISTLQESDVDIPKVTKPGSVLKVELPSDDQILNWEKPLSEQSETVRKALEEFIGRDSPEQVQDNIDTISKDIKKLVSLLSDVTDIDNINNTLKDATEKIESVLQDKDFFKKKLDRTTQLQADSALSSLWHDVNNAKESNINNSGHITFNIDKLRTSLYRAKTRTTGLDITGKGLYGTLVNELGSDKAASQWLSDHGIKGHKYFDGDSRSSEKGTFNFVIYDDTAIDIVETFFQAQEGEPTSTKRGAITISGEKKLIELFEGADLSTVLHEIGHIALIEYSALERSGLANDELKADMKTIRDWVGAEEGADLTRKQSEQFARGFEAYLREGKAPTGALRAAFERFKTYLTSVYKTAQALNVTLNKDIRQVFDRMVATNAEVERAAREMGFVAKTDAEMDALGMNEVDKFNAKKLIDKTVNKATELLSRARNKSLRTLRGNWHAEARDELRNEDLIYDITADIAKSGIDKTELDVIQKEVEAGFKTPPREVRDADGHPTGVWRAGENTFPEYFKDRGFGKKYVLNAINKALTDQKLTEKQVMTLDILVEAYRDETGRRIEEAGGQPVFKEDNRFDRAEFVETYGEDALNDLPNTDIIKDGGIPIDQAAFTYGMEDGDALIQRLFNAPPLNEAVDIRVAQKQAAHDATFIVEDYLADIKSYRDYQELMGRYINGATVDEQEVNDAIQRNVKRWEKEAREQNPDATQREIDDIVQGKMEAFREKKAKPKAIQEAQLKRLAKETMASKTVRDALKVQSYLSAMKKAASDERRAILSKDWGKASTANELGRFNYEMASLSKNIRAEVDKVVKNAKKVAGKKQGTLEHKHQEAILHLTSQYRLSPTLPTEPATIPDYQRLFAGDDAQFDKAGNRLDPNLANGGIPVPAFFAGGIADYRDLRMEQLRELDESLRFLEHDGKIGKNDFFSDGETLIADAMIPVLKEMDSQTAVVKRDKHDMLKGVTEGADKWYSRMLNMSYITTALGGYKSLVSDQISSVEKWVSERLKDLRDAHLEKIREYRDLVKPHRDRLIDSQRKLHRKYGVGASAGNIAGVSLKEAKLFVKDNGVPVPLIIQDNGAQLDYWEVEQVFDMAFHRMNEGNTNALLKGYDMTLEQVDSLLDQYLTKQDMRDVQAIINIISKLAPETQAVHMRLKGFPMRMVEVRPFTFKGEEFAGGYYPLNIDRKLASVENGAFASAKEMEDYLTTADSNYVVPFAKSTHTLSRRDGHGLPVALSLMNIDKHIDQSVRYITMAEGVKDVDKIITYKKRDADGKVVKGVGFKASAVRIMGENVYDQLRPALKHFSNPILEGIDTPGRRFVGYLRGIAVPAHIAWKTITGVKQFGSIPVGISALGRGGRSGIKKYAKGVAVVGVNPTYSFHTMNNKSAFMMERQNSYERDFLKSRFDSMTPAQREVSFGDRHITWGKVKDMGYATVRIPDLISVTPLWWGGYLDQIENGATETEAVRYADNIIENTQPIAQPLDLSAWFRDGSYWSVFNLHQTFTTGIHGQRQRTWLRGFRKGEISAGKYAMYNFMEVVVPATLSAIFISMLRGGDVTDPEEQKSILGEVLLYAFGMGTPMLSSTMSMAFSGTKYAPIEMAGGREFQQTVEGVYYGGLMLTGFDGMSRKERERAQIALAKAIAIQLKVPFSDVYMQISKGDTFMEKAFKQKKKK